MFSVFFLSVSFSASYRPTTETHIQNLVAGQNRVENHNYCKFDVVFCLLQLRWARKLFRWVYPRLARNYPSPALHRVLDNNNIS